MVVPAEVEELLRQQDGVISRRGARACGMSEDAWQWMLDSRRWRLLMRGVAVAHLGTPSDRQLSWAAQQSAGAGALLTGDAVLRETGLPIDFWRYDVRIPAHRQVRDKRFLWHAGAEPPALVRAWPGPTSGTDAGPRGIPAVSLAVAVVDAAEWAGSDRAAEWRLAASVQRGLADVPALRREVSGLRERTRAPLLMRVLDDVEMGAHALSELDFLDFLREHRLPVPDRLQCLVRRNGKRYLDAWWARQRVAAEVDGAHHRLVETWDADTLRSNEAVLALQGSRVLLLRVTTGNLRHDRPALARQFSEALL